MVYNPKTFFPYAASLRQSFLHCAIFPTAASRRSLDRISVPMWPFNLSVRLLIVALVCLYHTNQLIRRKPIYQQIALFPFSSCDVHGICGFSNDFSLLFPSNRQVAYVLLTSPPLTASKLKESIKFVRLACLMCAASVYPEPGSNSLILVSISTLSSLYILSLLFQLLFYFGSIFYYRWLFLILNLLFTFQCTFFLNRNVLYYITFHFVCQHFFTLFLKTFFVVFCAKNKISNFLFLPFFLLFLITNFSTYFYMFFSLVTRSFIILPYHIFVVNIFFLFL